MKFSEEADEIPFYSDYFTIDSNKYKSIITKINEHISLKISDFISNNDYNL